MGGNADGVSAWHVAPRMQSGVIVLRGCQSLGTRASKIKSDGLFEEVSSWVNVRWFPMASGKGISLI